VYPVLFHIGAVVIPSYGALSSIGVLLALVLAQRTAHTAGLNRPQVWNLCVIALFAALAGQRLLLIALNWNDLLRHPRWVLGLAMVHHPLLAAVGAFAALASAAIYARAHRMPFAATADALAAPLALGLAFEQFGALLAGSGYGTETAMRWAVVYTHPLAARWSGTPLGIPLHPVQAYAAIAWLTLALLLLVLLPVRRQHGDIAGLWLMGAGIVLFLTELWRDREGRGSLLSGAVDGPQAASIVFVLLGALLLRKRRGAPISRAHLLPEDEPLSHAALASAHLKDEVPHG
jgi:phosphatidylglycerol:prolipoprotein diacylglycerol transferase